ncbi:hypothetical protein ACFOZ1_00525 [Gracilibacillus marinus]|uniref:DUF7305 domain-containing protein n=1 Tax=Gracilibacillus marinus TaxID=630535 RepID=A0ABV8VQI3_9BACI
MNKMNNEKGAALLLVLLALTVLSLLGLAIAGTSLANINLTTVDREQQATYYIAEGGLTLALAEIEELVMNIDTTSEQAFYTELENQIQLLNNIEYASFEKNFDEQPIAKINIQKLSAEDKGTYLIEAKGEIGKLSYTLNTTKQITWTGHDSTLPPIYDNALLFVKESVHISGGTFLTGDIYLDSTKPNTFVIGESGGVKNGSIYVPQEGINNVLSYPVGQYGEPLPPIKEMEKSFYWEKYDQLIESFPSFPSAPFAENETIGDQYNRYKIIENHNFEATSWQAQNYVLSLDNDIAFNNFNVGQNIYIDTNNQDRNIIVNNMNLSNTHITILGSGTVNFYVENKLNFSNAYSTINNNGDISKVNFYVKGENNEVNISQATQVYGSIFAKNANFNFNSGGGFQGFIVTGGNTVNFTDGTYSNLFLIAPNADVNLASGANIKGTLVINKFNGFNGGTLTYQEKDLSKFPF